MSSPKVTYSYANGLANTIRPTSVTYPDNTGGTRVLTYDYGTAGGMNDKLSRVESLGFGGTSNRVQPSYLGLGTQVRSNYTQPQVRWDLATGSSPNPYAGLDRFGRVIDNKWINSSTSATLDQIKYTYDRASNRTTRENTVAKAQTTPKYFDELYGYDGSNRLTQMQRGQLAGTTSITNLQFAQDWGLDPTGNWQQFNEDSDGSGTNDLVQSRTANPVNEITDITNSVGSPWVQPGYDAAGNMTTIPQGNEPEEGFTGVYDAWNRLVKLSDEDGNVVAEYAYDGLTRRIKKTTAAETRHYLYNAGWQILEERVGSATTYDRQYVWGLRYIDECVLRDKSGGARLYPLQDANWNVDALVDTSGSVVERFSYSAYGVPTCLNPDFTAKAGSDYAWDVLYAGYKWDNESGMYQVRWRYLLSTLGCWLTRDPVAYQADDMNLLRYCHNRPLSRIDPHGLDDLILISVKRSEKDLSEGGYWKWILENYKNQTLEHDTAKELAEKLKARLKKGDCVKSLDLYAHGNPNTVAGIDKAAGLASAIKDTDVRHLSAEAVNYCKKCEIWLDGCNTGLNILQYQVLSAKVYYQNLAQQLANISGCTVWGSLGYLRGSHFVKGEKCTRKGSTGIYEPYDNSIEAENEKCWKKFERNNEALEGVPSKTNPPQPLHNPGPTPLVFPNPNTYFRR